MTLPQPDNARGLDGALPSSPRPDDAPGPDDAPNSTAPHPDDVPRPDDAPGPVDAPSFTAPHPDNAPRPDGALSSPRPDGAPSSPRPDGAPSSPLPEGRPNSTEPEGGPAAPEIVTRGPPWKNSWVWGTKLTFFSKRKADWLRESENKRAGAFYTKMTKLFVKKYGRHLGDDQDFAMDVADPPDSAADEVVHEFLSEEEKEFRATHYKTLRTRIAEWYRREYGSLLKSDEAAFKDLFTGVLDGAPPKPQRGRIVHFYSRKYYDTRIKTRVEARLASLKRRTQNSGEAKPETIDVVSKVTNELWDDESPEFRLKWRSRLSTSINKISVLGRRRWRIVRGEPQRRLRRETLENAAYYLQPFVDAIQERFGMVATVLLCGPVGIRGGRIRMQSVHAGATLGIALVNWPTSDWQGFQDVERSMVGFASKCFTDAECRARALPGTAAPLPPPPPLRTHTRPVPTTAPSMQAQMTSQAGDSEGRSRTVPVPTTAPSTQAQMTSQMQTSTGEQGECDEREGEQDEQGHREAIEEERRRKEVEEEERRRTQVCDKEWQRDDRAEWTDELGRAHVAFEVGRSWGPQWATCVQNFFDFEGAWGFVKGSCSMLRGVRPQQVSGWLSRGRKWTMPPALGGLPREAAGDRAGSGVVGFAVVDMVAEPAAGGARAARERRAVSARGGGLEQDGGDVMASLVWWWGEVVSKREEEDREEWRAAVTDVTWVLEQLLASGEIRRDAGNDQEKEDTEDEDPAADVPSKRGQRKRGRSAAGKKNKPSEDDGGDEEDAPPPPKKQKRAKGGAESEQAPRRTSRLRGDAPEDTEWEASVEAETEASVQRAGLNSITTSARALIRGLDPAISPGSHLTSGCFLAGYRWRWKVRVLQKTRNVYPYMRRRKKNMRLTWLRGNPDDGGGKAEETRWKVNAEEGDGRELPRRMMGDEAGRGIGRGREG
ncbi:hypothetical protein B0H14DRAFT_2654290 [Mycena olivaceomarginata]|nr:hypothetical protein B0H14DRAFT_2654290 [Mycena olivaceomarginata]